MLLAVPSKIRLHSNCLPWTKYLLYVKEEKRHLYVRRLLLSKSEYPFWVAHQHFIAKRKEGENRLVSRETERVGVYATLHCLKMKLASVVKRPLGKGLP